MFYLRYDDIEGLFRDAAENYQINADEAFDCDKINRSVHDQPDEEKKPGPEKNKKRGFIFWFLLLLSIGLLSYNIWSIESEKKSLQQNIASVNKSKPNNEKNNANTSVQSQSNNLQKSESLNRYSLSQNKEPIFNNVKTTGNDLILQSLTKKTNESISDNIKVNKGTNADISPSPILERNILLNDQLHLIDKNTPNLIQPSGNTDSSRSAKNKATAKNISSKFYAGAFFAPDVTFIKFQKTTGVGATFGLTAGYQFNKNWSIESGISLDMKKYYTDGEYFDKSHVPDFYNGQLLSVTGTCNMLEIPINVRYKFASNSNHNWTAALGTSSYFMTKESYNYSMIAWGQTVEGKFTNYPSSTHLFAVINLSAGYEKKLNNASLLIEPYYKVPIRGIGTGNLYMSSAGINIGIKKYFGRK